MLTELTRVCDARVVRLVAPRLLEPQFQIVTDALNSNPCGVLTGVFAGDLRVEGLEALESFALASVYLRVLEAVVDSLPARSRGREERLDQRPRKEAV